MVSLSRKLWLFKQLCYFIILKLKSWDPILDKLQFLFIHNCKIKLANQTIADHWLLRWLLVISWLLHWPLMTSRLLHWLLVTSQLLHWPLVTSHQSDRSLLITWLADLPHAASHYSRMDFVTKTIIINIIKIAKI